jgi:hypothetical protein
MKRLSLTGAALLMALPSLPVASVAKPNPLRQMADIMRMIEGRCELKVNSKPLECDGKLMYIMLKNHRVEFAIFPKLMASLFFGGGRDMQLELEHYQLTVDRLVMAGGTTVPADGYCSTDTNTPATRVYKVECKALAHDGRTFELTYMPADKTPVDMLAGR